MADLVCWKCGAGFGDLPLPLSRFAECKACHAKLHACRQCEFYDTTRAKSCREPIAEEVTDKKAANFCDYFRATADAWKPAHKDKAEQARSDLEALFGMTPGSSPIPVDSAATARAKLDELFRKKE